MTLLDVEFLGFRENPLIIPCELLESRILEALTSTVYQKWKKLVVFDYFLLQYLNVVSRAKMWPDVG